MSVQSQEKRLTSPERKRGGAAALVRWGLLLLLAGYLLFSHLGCHGDEDNELFASLVRVMGGR